MLITIIVIIGLSVLIVGHELGHFAAAKLFGLRVDEFGFGFPPRIAAKKWGETEYSINWLPFGGFVKIAGENPESDKEHATSNMGERKHLFHYQPAWKRVVVLVAGVAANFLLGWWLLAATLMMGTSPAVIVAGVSPNSPAEAAGLRAGDVIRGFKTTEEFVAFVGANRGTEVAIHTVRGSGEETFTLTPRVDPPAGEGALGVQLAETGAPPQGFFSALWEGLKSAVYVIGFTFQALGELLRNLFSQGRVSADIVGPLGIVAVAQRTGSLGIAYLFELLSLISLNLAVINLIPFPALDGGRVLFTAIEKIKGSPIPRHIEGMVNGVGFVLLLALMVLVTVRDVVRWF
ncbi:MAG: site-2 protease family protein [Candidatus Liptonbacteria bacterium]|nr:site-2 protease family protein [Candidatus Liptonbacteria bacterium]MBI3114635.1 site-2 protease family protein [Candidatus Harrisonbacteria bacterium]